MCKGEDRDSVKHFCCQRSIQGFAVKLFPDLLALRLEALWTGPAGTSLIPAETPQTGGRHPPFSSPLSLPLQMPVPEALLVGSYPAETRADSVSFVANSLGKCYILCLPLEDTQCSLSS